MKPEDGGKLSKKMKVRNGQPMLASLNPSWRPGDGVLSILSRMVAEICFPVPLDTIVTW